MSYSWAQEARWHSCIGAGEGPSQEQQYRGAEHLEAKNKLPLATPQLQCSSSVAIRSHTRSRRTHARPRPRRKIDQESFAKRDATFEDDMPVWSRLTRLTPPPTLTGQWEEDKRQGLGVFKVSPILQCGVRGAPSPRARVRATAPWAVRAHAERAVGLQSHCD